MARERYKEPTGLDSGIDDGVPEVGLPKVEPLQVEEYDGLPAGYAKSYKPEGYSAADCAQGYCAYTSMDFDDMFEAFSQRQRGVVGGDRTVDDYSPDGISDDVSSLPRDDGISGADTSDGMKVVVPKSKDSSNKMRPYP